MAGRKAYLVRDNSDPNNYAWRLVCPPCWHHDHPYNESHPNSYRKIEVTDEADTFCERCDCEIL